MNCIPPESDGDHEPSALDWAWEKGVGAEVVRRTKARVRRRRRRVVGGALASLAVLLGLGIAAGVKSHSVVVAGSASTVVAAPARQVLQDGSVIDLKAGAVIAADFSGPFRDVTLVRGEAHFQVVHDAKRPFRVLAHGVEIRDLGTAFSVDLQATTVEVLVSEGRVALAPTADQIPAKHFDTIVVAGNRAIVSVPIPGRPLGDISIPQVSAVSETEMTESDSWRVPRLEFEGAPLVEIVDTFNRYASLRHGTRIVLADRSLEKLQLSGILRVDNCETLLQVLDANFGIKADPEMGQEIRLHASR